jgi:hypothetical protein
MAPYLTAKFTDVVEERGVPLIVKKTRQYRAGNTPTRRILNEETTFSRKVNKFTNNVLCGTNTTQMLQMLPKGILCGRLFEKETASVV